MKTLHNAVLSYQTNLKDPLSYREGPDSTFTSNGKTYSLDIVYEELQLEKAQSQLFQLKDLTWVLKYTSLNAERLLLTAHDTTSPILVTKEPQGLVTIDGAHRLTHAALLRRKTIRGYFVSPSILQKALL